MPRSGHQYETIVWTTPARAPLVGDIIDRMKGAVRIIGVGGVNQPAVSELASRWGCEFDDDFRTLVIDHPATYLLLASMDRITPALLFTAMQQGTTILTLEPVAAGLSDLTAQSASRNEDEAAPPPATSPGRILHVPAFTRSPGWLSAADPQLVLGSLRSVCVQMAVAAEASSLFARLHEAWHLILDLAAIPETIDCVLHRNLGSMPDQLREIAGSLTAHARLPDGSSALIQLQQCASTAPANRKSATATESMPSPVDVRCDRMLHLCSETGRLRVTDQSYELFDAGGGLLDARHIDHTQPVHTFADAVAHHWLQLIDRPALADPPRRDRAAHDAAVLACCLACMLSARTGQPESPGKLMAAHGWR